MRTNNVAVDKAESLTNMKKEECSTEWKVIYHKRSALKRLLCPLTSHKWHLIRCATIAPRSTCLISIYKYFKQYKMYNFQEWDGLTRMCFVRKNKTLSANFSSTSNLLLIEKNFKIHKSVAGEPVPADFNVKASWYFCREASSVHPWKLLLAYPISLIGLPFFERCINVKTQIHRKSIGIKRKCNLFCLYRVFCPYRVICSYRLFWVTGYNARVGCFARIGFIARVGC